MTRLHAVVTLLVALALPAWSRTGDGLWAWTMYSRSAGFSLVVVARGPGGAERTIAPSELAAVGGGPAASFLAGAERLRHMPGAALVRDHLGELAGLACQASGAAEVELRLAWRPSLDAPIEPVRQVRACDRR